MSTPESGAVIVFTLQALGLSPASASQAATDPRISWTDEALAACIYDCETSGMRNPAGALWSVYLQHGTLPKPAPTARPVPAVPPCSFCGQPVSECGGVHGLAMTLVCVECAKPLMDCKGRHAKVVPFAPRKRRKG